MSKQVRPIVSALGLAMVVSLMPDTAAVADLASYVQRADGAFAWTVAGERSTPLGKVHDLSLTSQVWQGAPWKHHVQIFEPVHRAPGDTVLLFITGGDNTKSPGPGDAATGFALAQACGATCVMLHQVPNQPLLGNKREDALIAETFVRFLETGDETWPLLFPMTKSAVRVMDAIQEWARQNDRPAVTRFVVAGASKRGWTTWLTGAVDPRVAAIAPMVIDTLNMKAQKAHALEVWGRLSEQIDDYTSRGLTEQYDTERGRRLWELVDPYMYRNRLLMPKLLIFGTNDPYWTLDALNIYWDGLKEPKDVVYLPNAGHGLQPNRDYATNGVGALFRHVVSDRPLPKLTWSHRDAEDGRLRLEITSSPTPKSAKLWIASAPTRDFRKAHWESTPLPLDGTTIVGEVGRPESGYIALLGDLEYEIDGVAYHLSTQVRQAGAGTEK